LTESVATLLTFVLTSLIIEVTPGPNMTYLIAISLHRGRRVGLAAVAGITLGLAGIGVAAALGLTAIISESDFLYETLRWAGVAYFIWLAVEMWRGMEDGRAVVSDGHMRAMRTAFQRGLITNLLNPKAAVFYMVALPTFVQPGGSVLGQTLVLTAVYVAVATAVHSALALLAGASKSLIGGKARQQKVRRVLAVALLLVAVWVAVSTHR
jgi:threonine/homoserine/homoserine lactone efflux protein